MSYRFGRFALDYDTRQLLEDGREVRLSPKAFELLALLLQNRSRAVSKADLLERLWPSTFVEETNLAGLIAEIRRALGDSATQPAFVRTVHKFGYRFVGDVRETTSTPSAPLALCPRPVLVLEHRRTALLEGANVIGRAPDATIVCDLAGVSRHHARIVLANGEATIEDLGSKNGTFVRGERVASARLSDGDEIRLGVARLTFRIESPVEPTDTVPVNRSTLEP